MKHYIKLKQTMMIIAAAFLIFTVPVAVTPLAHSYDVNGVTTKCDDTDPLCPKKYEDEKWPVAIVDNVIRWLMYAVGLAAVALMIVGGLRYILAAGNEQQMAGAKKMILGALVGLGIAVLSIAIIELVKYFLGVA